MTDREYIEEKEKQTENLMQYEREAEKELFNRGMIPHLSTKLLMERYNICKDSIIKNINTVSSIKAKNKELNNEEEIILNAILTMSKEEKDKLKKFLLDLKTGKI
jgi:predicted small secreted protein